MAIKPVRVLVIATAAVLAALFVVAPGNPAPALAAPANDNLADAVALTTPTTSGIVATGNSYGAFLEGGEDQPCGGSIDSTVWYTWTSPPGAGSVVFDTWGSDFDTVVAIYTGSGFPLTNVGCNDDFNSTGESALQLSYSPSTTYYIQVGGSLGATGDIVLNMSTGAVIYVNSTSDSMASDTAVTLREAILLARGGTAPGGLGRALSAAEASLVLNAAAAGASGSDLVHFVPGVFPPSTGATITVAPLPALYAGSDAISGIGAGVIIDGWDYAAICIDLQSDANVVEGLDLRGCDVGINIGNASGNRIGGGLTPAQANFISGSDNYGIRIQAHLASTGDSVVGNVIGFRRDGTFDPLDLNNIGIGVGGNSNTIGGNGPGEGNVVSMSMVDGIQVWDDNNVIKGNKIGTDPTGSFGYGNIGHGLSIGGTGNIIGGTGPGEGNIIASNGQWGINVNGTGVIGTTIRGNSIHSNTQGGIAGSETGYGVPVISSVSANAVSGTACGLCTVDIYSDTGNQGRVYVGTTTADALGVFAATGIVHPLGNVTATATINSGTYAGTTSHFSAPFAAATNLDGDGVFDSVDACVSVPEDEDGFQDTDGCPDPDNDSDGICDPGQASVSCTGSDEGKQVFDPAGTLPAPTIDCRNIAEDYDAFHDSDGCPEPDNDNDGKTDPVDSCPGTHAHAGADGMLGAPQDLNHNGIKDASEATFSTDDAVLVFEDYDGVIDSDGCHDSPGDDFDGDTFSDDLEALFLGTNPMNGCPLTPDPNDEDPDPWPVDFDDNRVVNVVDVVAVLPPYFGSTTGDPDYSQRRDLVPDGVINILDVTKLLPPVFGSTCP